MVDIHLLNLPHVDNTYNNTLSFTNKDTKHTFFSSRILHSFSNINVKDNVQTSSITLNVNHSVIDNCNYLYMITENKEKLYYFIINFEHTTPNTTTLIIQLDCFTTYLNDVKLLPSFVERCHVPRWNGDTPTANTIDEGLPLNEYVIDTSLDIATYNNGLIISSTAPLGYCPDFNRPNEGEPPTGGGGTISDGYITKSGYRFIKGYEGFAPTGLYLSGENFRTVGYGSTEQYNLDRYNEHKPFPCSEQKASEIYADRIINEFGKSLYNKIKSDGIASKITQSMFDAMVSTCYNCGFYGFTEWETSPYQLIKNDPFNSSIRTTWEKFAITSNGTVLEGLKLRRKAEADIYLSKLYEFRSILKYKDNGSGVGVADGVITDNRGDGFIPSYLPSLSGSTLEIIQEV